MHNTNDPSQKSSGTFADPREVSDTFDDQSQLALDQLAALGQRLAVSPADAADRRLAAQLIDRFATRTRQNLDSTARGLSGNPSSTGEADAARALVLLQRGHERIERIWLEIEPHLAAVASGQLWYDIDVLREGTAVFGDLMHDHFLLERSLWRLFR